MSEHISPESEVVSTGATIEEPPAQPDYGSLPDFSGYEPPVVTTATWAPPITNPKPPVSTIPRSSTIVWGLIVLAVGIVVIAAAAGASFDMGLAMISLIGAAGLLLIGASALGSIRRKSRPNR
ncbi:MAG: hypothetical protein FWD83_06740 [Promicromonosporaceae bacterium]|nr:hypothetical protein [Promicromonosporaceae bacterium]